MIDFDTFFKGFRRILEGGLKGFFGRREKTPTPKTRFSLRTLLRTPRPLYYKNPPCVFYHKNVRSKAVFGP